MDSRGIFRPIISAIFMIFLAAASMAAEKPEFGVITPEEWAMGAPDQYPDARAIILFDEGQAKIGELVLDRHERIKILKKEGSEKAVEIEIPVYRGDKITNLKAHTILPDGSTYEVKEFFHKTMDEVEVKAFTFPSVQDGCIVEYQYRLTRQYYLLGPWYFQNDFYTVRSAFRTDIKLSKSSYLTPLYVNIPVYKRPASDAATADDAELFEMELTGLVPVKDEPLMGAKRDNLMSVVFTFRSPTRGIGWNEIGEYVDEWYDGEFGSSQKAIGKAAETVCAGLNSDEEKIAALYRFVAETIATDNDLELSKKLADILKNGKGLGVEKNLILVEMLKSQNIPARRLMIGLRNRRECVNVDIKNLNQFDRTLCFIPGDSTGYVLDPGAKYSIFPYPEARDLAVQGFLLDAKESRLMDIPHRPRVNGSDVATTINVDEAGNAVCTTTIVIKGFSMEKWREKQLDSLSGTRMAEDLLEDLELEHEIKSASLEEDHDNDRYLFNLVLELPNFVSVIDDNFFFTPFIIPVEDNPFSGDIRNFPVDFNYTFRNRHQIHVILPADMVITDAPKNIYQTMEGGKFKRQVMAEGNELAIQSELNITRASFPTSVYKNVKEMFDIMSQSCLDQALAIKVTEATGEL